LRKIYLDVCTLCRPYDDQSLMRVHLETFAVLMILKAVEAGRYQMLYSPVHNLEISAISTDHERVDLLLLLKGMALECEVDKRTARVRAEELVGKGFGIADAAHLAFSEAAQADFISCDDNLLKKCKKIKLQVWTGNPIAFCDKEDLK